MGGGGGKGAEVNIDCGWMQFFFFSPSPHLPPVLLLLWAREQEALHHPDRQRKRREGERKRDCDGGIKGYPSLSVTSFIVPCSVLPAHPSSAVTYTHRKIDTHFPPIFTHSRRRQQARQRPPPPRPDSATNTKIFVSHTLYLLATMTDAQKRWRRSRKLPTGLSAPVYAFNNRTHTKKSV